MAKIVVITGVVGGIGRAIASKFKEQGWYVVGIDLAEISDSSTLDRFIQADVSQAADWARIEAEIATMSGTVKALVNNAAVQICKPLLETSLEEWHRVLDVNLTSVFLGVKTVCPQMQFGSAIVNVSSVHAIATSPQIAAYAASKGGMTALTRALALELAPNTRVNAVLPGAVDTSMLRSGIMRGHVAGDSADELIAALGQKHVVKRIGQPDEIAEAVYFLAAEQTASFMTGQTLTIDGGATARLSTE